MSLTENTSRTKEANGPGRTLGLGGLSWPVGVAVLALMLVCFCAGVWSRPYLDTYARALFASPKPQEHPSADADPPEEDGPGQAAYEVTGKPGLGEEPEPDKERALARIADRLAEEAEHGEPLKGVCLILDDFGYNLNTAVMDMLRLDPGINVAILPDLPASEEVMEAAVELGHEVLIHAPFEGVRGSTEPEYIRKGDDPDRIRSVLDKWFQSLPGALGINNHQGSLATTDRATMREVMLFLKERNLLFVDSWTAPGTVGFRVARELGVSNGARIIPFLDNQADEESILANFHIMLGKARVDRPPIAIAHVTKRNTRKLLMDMIPKLQSMGYRLVPVSQAVRPVWKPYVDRYDVAG